MVLRTSLLYIGLCNILEDSMQATLHLKNLFCFVEHVRFGQDGNVIPRGIVSYKELLGILLFLDGTTEDHIEIKTRFERANAIQVPQCPSFKSISEACIAFQQIRGLNLHPVDMAKLSLDEIAKRLIDTDSSFLQRLLDFEVSNTPNDYERQDIAVLRLFMRYMASRSLIRTCTSMAERIEHDCKKEAFLDEIDTILEQQKLSAPTMGLPIVTFPPTLCNLFGHITSGCRLSMCLIKHFIYLQSGLINSPPQTAIRTMLSTLLRLDLKPEAQQEHCRCSGKVSQ